MEVFDSAENFLVDCIGTRKSNIAGSNSFDSLRYIFYHENKKFELKNLPCTSSALRYHIIRAYFKTNRWITSATADTQRLEPQNFGYHFDKDKELIPLILLRETEQLPDDFPCLKCARKDVCTCLVLNALCCKFCRCTGVCKNKNPYFSGYVFF